MDYSIKKIGNLVVVRKNDYTQENENRALTHEVKSMLTENVKFVAVDLDGILYINSVGLNFMISMLTSTRKIGGDAVLISPNTTIIKLLEVTKLKDMFTIVDDINEAAKALQLNSAVTGV